MKDIHGNIVEIRGWTQYGTITDTEISFLEIKAAGSEISIKLGMSSDEIIAWCKKHDLPFTDLRSNQKVFNRLAMR